MTRKFRYVFELHKSALHVKNCNCIVIISFYRALQKFQYINIFYLFLPTQIGTKFWYVFKLHRSDLHTKISHRIQHVFFYRAFQKFKCINVFCFCFIYTDLLYMLKLVNVLYIGFLVLMYQRIYKDY